MTVSDDRAGNRIIDALPPQERQPVLEESELVELSVRDSIYERGKPIDFVYFPVSGVISLVSEMEDGRAVEVATVGNEGMAGVPVFLQSGYTSAHMAFCQVPGSSLRLKAQLFSAYVSNGGTFHALLQRYTQALFSQVAQSSACNRLHPIEQRCARWILQTDDRVPGNEFELTQEFLAQMLGVQRTSVTAVASELQSRGHIRYARGRITVTDRPGLEADACECYAVIRDEFDRLLP